MLRDRATISARHQVSWLSISIDSSNGVGNSKGLTPILAFVEAKDFSLNR